jgi:hypothetical protein
VAWNDDRAAKARGILGGVGIDVDSALNGIWLPNTAADETIESLTRHRRVHTNKYYETLTERLEEVAGDRTGVETVLKDIKTQISEDRFPY